MPDKKTLIGIAIGVGVAVTAPLAAWLVLPLARPIAKGLLKHSLIAGAMARERLTVAVEDLSDLVAEVRAEVDDELVRKGAPRPAGPDGPGAGADANGSSEAPSRRGAPS